MPLQVGELFALVTAEDGPFRSAMDNVGKSLKETGSKVSGFGKTLTLGLTTPIVGAGIAAFKLASDYEESLNKVNVAFGDSASEVKSWSDTTLKQFGIARGSALDMAALFGDMSTSMGFSTSEASKMSTELVGLAADLASFKNIGIDQAETALKSIFTGETESLKGLGIVMTQANLQAFAMSKGLKENIKDMTQAEQVSLRYAYVMDKTKNAQGDFSRTSDGAANQMRIFQESLKELGETFGQILLPHITKLITFVNTMIEKFGALDENTKKNIISVLGIAAAIGPLLVVVGTLISSVGSIVSGFSAMSGVLAALTGPVGLVVLAVVGLIAVITTLAIKNEEFRNNLIQAWEFIKQKGIELWTSIVAIWDKYGKNLFEKAKVTVMNIFETLRHYFMDIILPMIMVFLDWLKKVWDEKLRDVVMQLVGFVAKLADGAMEIYNKFISPILNWLIDKLGPIFISTFKIILKAITPIVYGIIDIISGVIKVLSGVIDFIVGVFTGDWKKAWNGLITIFEGIWGILNGVFLGLPSKLTQIGKDMITGLWNGIKSMSAWIKGKVTDFVEGIGSTIKDFFGIASPSKLMKEYGKFISEGLSVGIEANKMKAIESMGKMVEAMGSMPIPTLAAQGGGQVNNQVSFAGIFDGASITVRNDGDIQSIARELYNLQINNTRGRGRL